MKSSFRFAPLVLLLVSVCSPSFAAPPAALQHLRGTVTAPPIPTTNGDQTFTISLSTGVVKVIVPAKVGVAELIPISKSTIKPGSFLGIASEPDSSGRQVAREVVVFPAAARGTGEGSYPWDLPSKSGGHSRMTNGTVTSSSTGAGHSKMTNGTVSASSVTGVTLTYHAASGSGTQSIVLPDTIPYVTFLSGSLKDLIVGAHVFVIGIKNSTNFNAVRVLVGKNGLVPPM